MRLDKDGYGNAADSHGGFYYGRESKDPAEENHHSSDCEANARKDFTDHVSLLSRPMKGRL